MFARLLRWLPLALIALVALWLRTRDLAVRPMHADEANQAVKTGELLEHGDYAFDPQDHHGPTLYYAALPLAWLRGQTTLGALSESTVRLVPALAGTISVLLLAWLAAPLGRWTALAGAAFLAVSPPAVYYSRYFIQETLLVAFTLAALLALFRWWRTGRIAWAFTAGIAVGLMQATKATAPVYLLAALVAFAATRPGRPTAPRWLRHLAVGFATAVLTAALFYSSFGTHFSGLRDALAAYGSAAARATSAGGHEKPWWYYLRLFGWHREGGLLWQQIAFSALSLCGVAIVVFRRLRGPASAAPDDAAESATDSAIPTPSFPLSATALSMWAALYTTILLLVLSLTPYKTPWHAIHLVPGLALLAATALAAFPSWQRAIVVFCVVVAMQSSQVKLAAFFRPSDARNPYAYVHSSPDVLKFRALAAAALATNPEGVIRVIAEEYWPIPWYLRAMPKVGYWTTPPADCDGALVIVSQTQREIVRARLRGNYRETMLGLRPGVLCVVFSRLP